MSLLPPPRKTQKHTACPLRRPLGQDRDELATRPPINPILSPTAMIWVSEVLRAEEEEEEEEVKEVMKNRPVVPFCLGHVLL